VRARAARETGGIALEEKITTLDRAPLGGTAFVVSLPDGGALRRLLDLGLVEDAAVVPLFVSPSGGTRAYLLRGAVIALRRDIAGAVTVRLQAQAAREPSRHAGAKERVDG